MWSRNKPDRIVSSSSWVCQCGGILYPFGNLSRRVNIPFFEGSPASTAIWARLGRSGGTSLHLISPGLTKTASGLGAAGVFAWAPTARASTETAIILDRVVIGVLLE